MPATAMRAFVLPGSAAQQSPERLVPDVSGLPFADCAGVRALAAVAGLVPDHCPVIVRSARPAVRRILELTGADLESGRGAPYRAGGPMAGTRAARPGAGA